MAEISRLNAAREQLLEEIDDLKDEIFIKKEELEIASKNLTSAKKSNQKVEIISEQSIDEIVNQAFDSTK